MRNGKILIVDDDASQLTRYVSIAKEAGLTVFIARTIKEAVDVLEKESLTYVLTDIHLKESNEVQFEGLEILKMVKGYPEVLPIIMSADPNIETYEKALKLGALYYLRKPIIGVDEFLIAIQAAKNKRLVERASRSLMGGGNSAPEMLEKCPDGVVIDSENRFKASRVAQSKKIPAVLFGETGTGKEEVAKLIHRMRCEVEGLIPFVAVNCAILSSSMAHSILFGHKKGAFTGATETTNGLVGEANGGILFLDEIHALPSECQLALLRVLNDGTYMRMGDMKPISSEFQVIAASTKNLDDEAEQGRFLLDLRMRITGIDIDLKPLRQRKDDIDILVKLFFARERISIQSEKLDKIIEKCKQFQWVGNIRQLFKALQSLVALAMTEEDINAENLIVKEPKAGIGAQFVEQRIPGVTLNEITSLIEPLKVDRTLEESVSAYEKAIMQAAFARHETIIDAAHALGMSKSGFTEKRKKHGLYKDRG